MMTSGLVGSANMGAQRPMSIQEIVQGLISMNREDFPHVFVDFSGHVGLYSVRIHKDGWDENKEPDYRGDFYVNSENDLSEVYEFIRNLQKYVEHKRVSKEHEESANRIFPKELVSKADNAASPFSPEIPF